MGPRPAITWRSSWRVTAPSAPARGSPITLPSIPAAAGAAAGSIPKKRATGCRSSGLVILSEAKDLIPVASGDEVLRFAQDDMASVSFEVLHRTLVLLGRGARLEGTEAAALAGLRIGLARIEAVSARRKIADHGVLPRYRFAVIPSDAKDL